MPVYQVQTYIQRFWNTKTRGLLICAIVELEEERLGRPMSNEEFRGFEITEDKITIFQQRIQEKK